MACSEANGGGAGVDVVPVVVCISNAEVSSVFISVAVRVADQGSFPVVVKECVRNGDIVGSVGELMMGLWPSVSSIAISGIFELRNTYINQTVVVIFIVVHVGRNIAVVNPDVGGIFCINFMVVSPALL